MEALDMVSERIQAKGILGSPLYVLLLFISLTILLWPTLAGISERWLKFDQAYSHGLLLLGMSMFLVAQALSSRAVIAGFYPRWLVPLVVLLTVYVIGEVMRVQALSQLVVVPLYLTALALLLGWNQVWYFAVPVGILFFGVPVWDYLAWGLQILTVEINRLLLGLFNIDFKVEGVFVYLIGVGAFEVAHGCSGLRYLLVGQSLALIYGQLNLSKIRSKVTIYFVSVFLALTANWIRVFVIIYVGYESRMQSNLINEHEYFGWWVFAGTLVPLFLFGRFLEKRESIADRSKKDADSQQFYEKEPRSKNSTRSLYSMICVITLTTASWLLLPTDTVGLESEADRHTATLVNDELWIPLFRKTMSGWSPNIVRADRSQTQVYTSRESLGENGKMEETLFVGLYTYESQQAGHELIHYDNRLYNPSDYFVDEVYDLQSEEALPMSGMTLKRRGSQTLIHLAYGYYVEGRWADNELQAKLAQLPGLMNARTDASLLVIGFECGQNCDPEQKLLQLQSELQGRAEMYLDDEYAK